MEMQCGIYVVGSSTTALKRFTVNFPKPFDSAPILVANTLQGVEYAGTNIPDVFVVSVVKTTTTSAVIQLQRVDAPSGWAQNLRLNWIAVTQ